MEVTDASDAWPMRYALCLHGMATGTTDIGNPVDFKGALPYFQKNVLRPNVDVFCHSWFPASGGELLISYGAREVCCEPQKSFPGTPETRSIYSRWFSAMSAANMAISTGQYDGILIARYDLVFKVAFPWDQLDPRCLWTSKWRQKPAPDSGYLDYWFYGNRGIIGTLCHLYHMLDTWFAAGLKQNGHNVVGKMIDQMASEPEYPVKVQQWGEQPEDFQLLRRMLGATN